jgi:hypothetical protein
MPYPRFRLAEFPGLDTFATSMQGLIPFSENFGFLCRADGAFDQAFGVAAHEAAHQWWGNLVIPSESPGSRVLMEGMANFSAALLYEEEKGPAQRRAFLRLAEALYEKSRSGGRELPLVEDRAEGPGGMAHGGSQAYNKGAWAFWMLMDHMGRDCFMAGLRDFIARYRDSADHPDLEDLLAALRARARDPGAFDAFTAQWFRGVDLPWYQVASARRTPLPEGGWKVVCTLVNRGGTRMPVTVALVADGRSCLETTTLGAGEQQTRTWACPFRPDRIEVDPDVRVLQTNRREAVFRF